MQKFFVEKNQIVDKKAYIRGEDVNHIINVLKLKKGEEIIICDKESNISYKSKLLNISKEKVECDLIEKIEYTTESLIDVTIFQGLPKADKMEYIIQKSTEIGVKEIVPVKLKRCIVKLDQKDALKKCERWQKIAETAAKQSKRDIIPKIGNVIDINNLKNEIKKFDLFLVAYEEEESCSLKQILKQEKKKSGLKIAVLIGTEGGLEKEEVEILKLNGAKVITLGKRILRTETAPIVVLSNIMYEFEM